MPATMASAAAAAWVPAATSATWASALQLGGAATRKNLAFLQS